MQNQNEAKVYKFNELSEAVQSKVIKSQSQINLACNWWEGIYNNAECIGMKIMLFDIRSQTIITEMDWDDEEFKKTYSEQYLKSLTELHDYLISDEAIKETLVGMEYDFTADGVMLVADVETPKATSSVSESSQIETLTEALEIMTKIADERAERIAELNEAKKYFQDRLRKIEGDNQ